MTYCLHCSSKQIKQIEDCCKSRQDQRMRRGEASSRGGLLLQATSRPPGAAARPESTINGSLPTDGTLKMKHSF